MLLGEIVRTQAHAENTFTLMSPQDLDQEDDIPLQQVDYSVLDSYHRRDIANKKAREDFKSKILYEQKGFCKEGGEGDGY